METKHRHCSPSVAECSNDNKCEKQQRKKKIKITKNTKNMKNTKNTKNSPLPLKIMYSVRVDKVIKKESCGNVDVLCRACKAKAFLEEIRAKILREETGDNFEMMSYEKKKTHYDLIMDYYGSG